MRPYLQVTGQRAICHQEKDQTPAEPHGSVPRGPRRMKDLLKLGSLEVGGRKWAGVNVNNRVRAEGEGGF